MTSIASVLMDYLDASFKAEVAGKRLVDLLPKWDELTDLDKGCALFHLYKCETEGSGYAEQHYPCKYWGDEALAALPSRIASKHAQGFSDEIAKLSESEDERLYNLALDAEERVRG